MTAAGEGAHPVGYRRRYLLDQVATIVRLPAAHPRLSPPGAGLGRVGGALVTAVVVFASALSPALIGMPIDAGVALEAQLLTMAACCPIAALWMGALLPRLDRLATTWACGQRCGSRRYPPAHTACEVAIFLLRISLSAENGQRIYWRTAGAAGSFT